MAHRKPVVAFAVGGIPEWLVDGETGYLVPRCDTRAMAAAIDRLLADPALAARLGQAGHARLETHFSQAAHLNALDAALLAAVGQTVHEVPELEAPHHPEPPHAPRT